MSLLQSLSVKKKITAIFADGSSRMNVGIPSVVELLNGVDNIPVEVSGDVPESSQLLKDLAASANRKITCAPNGLLLPLPVVESISEPVVEPVAPKPRVSRGDIHPSHAPKVERKYQTLSSIFFMGSVQDQILSVYKARVVNPQKVLDYKAALAAGDVNLGTKLLKKSLAAKLAELGIDHEDE
jgi:hypothetical protein